MTPEALLAAALDRAPHPVRLWWRDDDAGADDERLLPLLRLAENRAAPVALAVVPEWLIQATTRRILDSVPASVLQHGIAHADHSVPPARKIELGGSAAVSDLVAGLDHCRRRLAAAFGDRFLPVLVPPWNRIAPALLPHLPKAGLTAVSTFGSRGAAISGLRRVNTHLDLVFWREGRPLPLDHALSCLARLVAAHGDEPIGILSHHKVMDSDAFVALDRILALVQDHARARLASARELFGEKE